MYKSFMITEALLHNPVVHTFVQLISENKNDRMKDIKLNKPGNYVIYKHVSLRH